MPPFPEPERILRKGFQDFSVCPTLAHVGRPKTMHLCGMCPSGTNTLSTPKLERHYSSKQTYIRNIFKCNWLSGRHLDLYAVAVLPEIKRIGGCCDWRQAVEKLPMLWKSDSLAQQLRSSLPKISGILREQSCSNDHGLHCSKPLEKDPYKYIHGWT